MTPTFRIVADGADITSLINDRLLLLRTTDKPGVESDDFELRVDDRDCAVSLPSRGASIEIFLGYIGTALTRLGRYTVDEVELSGPPDTLVIRGKASDMRGSGKTTRSGSSEGVSLGSIVNDVVVRNGWLPICPVTTEVPRVDQLTPCRPDAALSRSKRAKSVVSDVAQRLRSTADSRNTIAHDIWVHLCFCRRWRSLRSFDLLAQH